MTEHKVYVLTGDICDSIYGSDIELFGVFSTMEKAKARAFDLELETFDISIVELNGTQASSYLGGYSG